MALHPDGTGRRVFSDFLRMFGTDGCGCRSNGRLRRPGMAKRPTFLSATATATATPLTHAPTGSPAAPRRPRRLDSTAGRRSRFCVRPADRPAISNHAPAVSPAAPDDSGNYYNYKTAPTHPVTITMPAPHQSVFYRLDALPATQPTVSKH